MMKPEVSFLMTVFNAGPYIEAALQSICAQTIVAFEAVLVDDGSTDDSLEIMEQWASRDSRLRIISRPNTGIVGALRDGLQVACGRFIARMDADDLCDSRRLELQLKRFADEPDLVVLGSNAIAIDPLGRRLGMAPVPLTHEEIDHRHLEGVSSIYHSAAMIRRDAMNDVGGYRDFCPAEDYDLWLRLGEVGRLGNLPEPLLIWRRTANGLVASSFERQRRAVTQALAEAWQRRCLPGSPPVPDQSLQSRRDLYRQWAWMALKERERSTSRHYAAKALLHSPWSWDSWRLAACALRGY